MTATSAAFLIVAAAYVGGFVGFLVLLATGGPK